MHAAYERGPLGARIQQTGPGNPRATRERAEQLQLSQQIQNCHTGPPHPVKLWTASSVSGMIQSAPSTNARTMSRETDVQRRERRTPSGSLRRRRPLPRSNGRIVDFAATRNYDAEISPVWEAGPVDGRTMESVTRRDARLRRVLALSDVLASSLALAIVIWMVAGHWNVCVSSFDDPHRAVRADCREGDRSV